MSLISDDPSKGLTDFFRIIWGQKVEGFVYVPTLDRKTSDWRRTFFEWPKHEAQVVQHVLAAAAQGKDAYYSPSLYNSPKSAQKDNVKGSYVLWCEFDGDAPAYWDGEGHEGTSDSGEAVSGARRASDGMPTPTVRVQSSNDGHEHVYWRLNEFCTDVQWYEDCNRSITYGERADTSGWDATQILRPPFTTNYKRERPVTVLSVQPKLYARDTFSGLKPPPQIVNDIVETDDLPRLDGIIAKYKWDDEHFKMFMDPAIPEGNRSSALMRLGYFCIEIGMSDIEAYTVIENADSRWGKYVGRNDRKRRLVDIINRARQKHPNPITDTNFAGLLGTKVETGLSLTYGFMDFLASEVEVEWAIEGLLEKGGFGMVASMPGVGKTQWAIQLAISCALGRDFLGWKIVKPQRVTLLSLEMSHVGLKIFMQKIAREYDEHDLKMLQDNLIIVPLGEPIALDRPEGIQFVDTLLSGVETEGIIIDSLGKLSMEELSEKMARTLNASFLHIRKKHDVFLWLIHHNRKASDANKHPKSLSDVYGNMYLTQDMSSVIILYPDEDAGEIEVLSVKARFSELRKPFRVIRNENLHFKEKSSSVSFAGLATGAASATSSPKDEPPRSSKGLFNI